MEEKKWIDDVMQGLQGQVEARANPFLSTRVLAKLSGDQAVVRGPLIWAMAVVIFVLLLLNGRLLKSGGATEQAPDFPQYFGVASNDFYDSSVK